MGGGTMPGASPSEGARVRTNNAYLLFYEKVEEEEGEAPQPPQQHGHTHEAGAGTEVGARECDDEDGEPPALRDVRALRRSAQERAGSIWAYTEGHPPGPQQHQRAQHQRQHQRRGSSRGGFCG